LLPLAAIANPHPRTRCCSEYSDTTAPSGRKVY